ncbi:MAG: sugar transferase [Pirellulaceae bacterium]
MFAWIGKRVTTPWSRRTRWTPFLQNQREFQRTLAKERSRVDRDGSIFGFIILRLTSLHAARRQTVQLAKILHRRLRETDEKGHLGLGRIGVLLPGTDQQASEFVLDFILELAAQHGLNIEGEVFTYPDRTPRNDDQNGSPIPAEVEVVSSESRVGSPLAAMIPAYPVWKRALDVVGAGTGLVVSSPFLLVSAGLIKLTSPGPILFTQQRTGYLGKPFAIYKLRTMVINADEQKSQLREKNERDGPAFKMRKDPRITRIGKFLRSTGLDELPQLVNVLKGDMSLVGPRPLPVDEADQCLVWQKRRADVKPGLTCFWQLAKSRQIPFTEWMRLDLQYAKRASLGLDIKLITKTFSSVILGRVGH